MPKRKYIFGIYKNWLYVKMEPGISSIPFEIFHKVLDTLDYPAIKKICDSSSEFRNLCATEYFKELINRKRIEYINENPKYRNMMYEATVDGDLLTIKKLVELGVDVNPPNQEISPLLNALMVENMNIVRYLAENGADLDMKSELLEGRTALMQAARYEHEDLVFLFLELGADPNIQDDIGMTALHWAAAEAGPTVVELLLEYGANPLIVNIYGYSASWEADAEGNVDNAAIIRREMEKRL